jgi:outer membrane protein assembly factor BamB
MQRIVSGFFLVAALLGSPAVYPAGSAEWRQWRGDHRDGVAETSPPLVDALPAEGLRPKWTSDKITGGNNGGWGSPVVADGKVYLFAHSREPKTKEKLGPQKYPYLADDKRGHLTPEEYLEYEKNRREEDRERGKLFGYRETVYCFDAATGKQIWKNERDSVYTRFLQSGTPAVVGGKLYILGAGLNAHCIDATTGKSLWNTRLPGEFLDEFMMSSFAVADGVAVVLAGHLRGLEAETGKIVWEGDAQKTRGVHSSPVVWNAGKRDLVLANVGGESTICVDPKDGKELWRVKSFANLSTPVVAGNLLITLGNNRRGGLRCFELTSTGAEPKWAYQRIADKGSSPVVVDGHVYAQGERRMACVDLQTGKEDWNTLLDLNTPQYTSVVAADHKIIYAFDGVLIVAADPREYRPVIEAKIDRHTLLASEATFRRQLKLDALEKEPDGLEKSVKLYQREVGQHGPVPCTSPAIVDGKLYLRLREAIACYDLTAAQALSSRVGISGKP